MSDAWEAGTTLTGTLHVYVAFDWGDEVHFDRARQLFPAEVHTLPRRRRTPSSIAFRPPPLRFALEPVPLDFPGLGPTSPVVEATVFDFAAVSVAMHLPFRLKPAELLQLAGHLADSTPLLRAARLALGPLHARLLPAIHEPQWQDDLSEEYLVFELPRCEPLRRPMVAAHHASWLAGLVRLETAPFSEAEIAEAVRLHLTYGPDDLFVPDWAAAVLLGEDSSEVLEVAEFANLQLLEYRHIDNRLDASLAAYGQLTAQRRSLLRFMHGQEHRLRSLGDLKVEANGLFERTGNALKLVGDQYLARAYRLVASRLHLREWERNIQRKLEVAEGVYQVLSDQAASHRTEFLEIIVIVLILIEVVMGLIRH